MSLLSEVYNRESVREFGETLRRALRIGDDYASLIELEYVEKKEDFAEAIKKFLRRYETLARKKYKGKHLKRPKEDSLRDLMIAVDEYGVKIVRAALISYALVKSSKENEENKEDSEEGGDRK